MVKRLRVNMPCLILMLYYFTNFIIQPVYSVSVYHQDLNNVASMLVQRRGRWANVSPLRPHNALKHHFISMKTDLIFLQSRVLERILPCNWLTKTWQFSLIFKPHQIIFIQYKSRIATAIRGL